MSSCRLSSADRRFAHESSGLYGCRRFVRAWLSSGWCRSMRERLRVVPFPRMRRFPRSPSLRMVLRCVALSESPLQEAHLEQVESHVRNLSVLARNIHMPQELLPRVRLLLHFVGPAEPSWSECHELC